MSDTLVVNRSFTSGPKLTTKVIDIIMGGLNDTQRIIGQLRAKGWTFAALADELEVHRETVVSWAAGRHLPANTKVVILALENLLRRQRVPKRRRYK